MGVHAIASKPGSVLRPDKRQPAGPWWILGLDIHHSSDVGQRIDSGSKGAPVAARQGLRCVEEEGGCPGPVIRVSRPCDTSEPADRRGLVVRKYVEHSRRSKHTYNLEVDLGARDKEEASFQIPYALYENVTPGDTVGVTVKQGALGYPWVQSVRVVPRASGPAFEE